MLRTRLGTRIARHPAAIAKTLDEWPHLKVRLACYHEA